MRHGRILTMIRRSAGALLLLGSVGVSTDTLTLAQDGVGAVPATASQPNYDDVYKRAGDRLAQQLQQVSFQNAPAAPAETPAPAPGVEAACPPAAHDHNCPHHGDSALGNCSIFGDGCGDDDELGDPWTLMSLFDDDCGNNCLKDKGITLGGWFQLGYSNHPDGAFTGNGPFLSQNEDDKFNLNQMYLFIAKAADGSKGFDWGYRADILYGVDGNEAQSFGNIDPDKWDYLNGWDHGIYEWAMPQLYGEVAMGDLAVKAGHFYTPIGYEVVTSPDNFFFSKQITFYNSEPFTHTGALATYKVSDKLTVIGGWTLGWDTGYYQFAKGSNGIVGATFTVSENTTLVYAGGFGDFGWRGDGAINSFILSQKWGEKWMSVHQFDVLQTNANSAFGADFATGGLAGDSTGFINYLFYEINSRWKLGTRQEWYKADGISYYTWTYGVNYKPTANLTIRPEMRHMWAPGQPKGAAGDIARNIHNVYGGEDVFGVDVIFKF